MSIAQRKNPDKWPEPRSAGNGNGLVASGQRVMSITTYDRPGLRVVGAGGTSGVPPTYYELFFDVYLMSVSGSGSSTQFSYKYNYYYRIVEKKAASNRGAQYAWVPKGSDFPNPSFGGGEVTGFPSNNPVDVSQYRLRVDDTLAPGDGLNAQNPTPSDFGWTGTGQGTTRGKPGKGPAGAADANFWNGDPSEPSTPQPGSGEPSAGEPVNEEGQRDDSSLPPYNNTVPGWSDPEKRRTVWNPPPAKPVTGAYVPVVYSDSSRGRWEIDTSPPPTRENVLGSGLYVARKNRKGFIAQHLMHEHEWAIQQRDTSGQTQREGTPEGYQTDVASDAIIESNLRYGFRFHYNPVTIDMGVTEETDIDPAVVVSGLGMSYPMDSPGSSVNFQLYLNRIEDMNLIQASGKGYRHLPNTYGPGNQTLTQAHMKGIKTRGTNYDLEFLFLAALGRPVDTWSRGQTADIGIIFGVPLFLNLGGPMKFVGRLSGLRYTHQYFTSEMVPTLTTVDISFIRMPDVVGFGTYDNWAKS